MTGEIGSTMTPNSGQRTGRIRQTIIHTLEAPMLQGISLQHFVDFKRKRDLYELRVEEKNREDGVQITPTSNRSSMDTILLRTLWRAKYIFADSVEDITEKDIRKCVEEKSVIKEVILSTVGKAIKNVKMKMNLVPAESRIWTLVYDYEQALEREVYADLPTTRPHMAVRHMTDRLKPDKLKEKILNEIELRKNEGFHRKNFYDFMAVVIEEAKH